MLHFAADAVMQLFFGPGKKIFFEHSLRRTLQRMVRFSAL